MPNINLIQEQRQIAKARERKTKFALMGTLACGALCVMATAAFMLDAARLNIKASALEQKKEEMKPLLEELKQNKQEVAQMQPRIKTLEEATNFTAKWGRVLDYITVNTPPDSWLLKLKAFHQDRTKPLIVTFNGVSLTHEAVGELILRLQASPEFEQVDLKYTQPKFSDNGQKQFEFEVDAAMAGTKEVTEEVTEEETP